MVQVGAEISFRQEDINRLFRKPTLHVRIFLIAKSIASIKGSLAAFASAFEVKTPSYVTLTV